MKKITFLLFGLLLIGSPGVEASVKINKVKVEAPFSMSKIKTPDFEKSREYLITDFGAVKGDKTKTSQAIEKAISEANKAGGGTVIIPEGEWLTKKLHFKSNVNLHLSEGAVLLFSDNPNDYLPAVHTTWEGLECYNYSPLIYAYKCKNVAITGKGEVKAKMDNWRRWAGRPAAHMNSLKNLYYWAFENKPAYERNMVNDSSNLRPQFIQFNRCENILIEDVKVTNSPFWTVHLYLSKNIIVRNIKVYAHGHNNDGIDPEMSQNILIENCTFDQGDDAIALKSGRSPEGWRSKTPTKNVVVRNCTVKNGHQLVAIGSELSGGIENIYVSNCTVAENAKMFHLVFIKTNERMGGYVKNIFVENVKGGKMDFGVLGIETDVLYQWRNLVPTIEKRLTPIRNINLTNIAATNVRFVSRVLGQKELQVKNVNLTNVKADTVRSEKHIHENLLGFSEK
ncbi:MAG: glycoside hydrolase family 28 protein [Porphyromonadaceae bacterium]|nr:glycoside hydrolase family 28 protein [Porphyromonadaceae bacterium]